VNRYERAIAAGECRKPDRVGQVVPQSEVLPGEIVTVGEGYSRYMRTELPLTVLGALVDASGRNFFAFATDIPLCIVEKFDR
jgi:hypothetical protein